MTHAHWLDELLLQESKARQAKIIDFQKARARLRGPQKAMRFAPKTYRQPDGSDAAYWVPLSPETTIKEDYL